MPPHVCQCTRENQEDLVDFGDVMNVVYDDTLE